MKPTRIFDSRNGTVCKVEGRQVKTFGTFWKTTNGQWVKKVIAIREGLQLTGETCDMHTGYTTIFDKVVARF